MPSDEVRGTFVSVTVERDREVVKEDEVEVVSQVVDSVDDFSAKFSTFSVEAPSHNIFVVVKSPFKSSPSKSSIFESFASITSRCFELFSDFVSSVALDFSMSLDFYLEIQIFSKINLGLLMA